MCLKMNAVDCIDLDGWALQLVPWFVVETIFQRDSSSKIGSKFHRPIFACFVQGKIPLSLVSSLFLWSETICMVFLCKFIPLFALLFCPSDCALWFTINWISEKSIVNTFKMFTLRVNFLAASSTHSRPYGFLFVHGSCHVEHDDKVLLYHVVRDRECIQPQFVQLSPGFAVNQALSASAVHNSLIPIKKTVRTLYFWYRSHNSNNSTLPNSRIISFESLLNGL